MGLNPGKPVMFTRKVGRRPKMLIWYVVDA
jgi:hypothetical protein